MVLAESASTESFQEASLNPPREVQ